jgi:UDP-N-acetylmuramoyl-tripeptide--D-alanyl-D-alanine ligase
VIALTLAEIAGIVGGELVGEDVLVDGPVVIDSREDARGGLFVAFVGERVDGHEYASKAAENGAVACLGSRPTSLPTVVVTDVQTALQDLARAAVERLRTDGLTVIAITGSQGKTSTKDLLAGVLGSVAPTVATKGSNNNEIGMPLTALRTSADTRFLVLELGARGIGHIAELTSVVEPDIGVVLNVGQAHIGEFGSREAIAQAKGELAEAARKVAVLNADDERVAAMASRTRARVVTFGADAGDVRVEQIALDRLGRPSFVLVTGDASATVSLQLVGAHQALNAAAAAAAALAAGLTLDQVADGLAAVASLSKWRMELHERADGVVLLNDAYNANPDSMRAGLDALAALGKSADVTRTIAVLGEMKELGDVAESAHREVGAYALSVGIDHLLVIGDAARPITDATESADFVLTNDDAVAWLRTHLREGDAVLFKASNGARLYEVAEAVL